MTALERKRQERQRRKEAGEVRVECWLSEYQVAMLDDFCAQQGMSRSDSLKCLVVLGAAVGEMVK